MLIHPRHFQATSGYKTYITLLLDVTCNFKLLIAWTQTFFNIIFCIYVICTDIADHSIIHFIFNPELHRQNDTFTVVAKNKPADLEM